jgi:hypothetical protein
VRGLLTLAPSLLLLALAGCSAPPPRLALDDPARPTPRGFVVVVHGVFPDGVWSSWPEEVAARLEREGAVAAVVDYHCGLLDYWFSSKVERTASRIAEAVRALDAAHARQGCKVPLEVAGIGYSGGTRVLLDAALMGVSFRRQVYSGSPIFLASRDLGRALALGRVQRLVNYCSLVDGFVWPLLPIGIWGYGGEHASRVCDRVTFEVHGIMPFAFERERVARETVSAFTREEHPCFKDPEFLKAVRGAVEYLEDRSIEEVKTNRRARRRPSS